MSKRPFLANPLHLARIFVQPVTFSGTVLILTPSTNSLSRSKYTHSDSPSPITKTIGLSSRVPLERYSVLLPIHDPPAPDKRDRVISAKEISLQHQVVAAGALEIREAVQGGDPPPPVLVREVYLIPPEELLRVYQIEIVGHAYELPVVRVVVRRVQLHDPAREHRVQMRPELVDDQCVSVQEAVHYRPHDPEHVLGARGLLIVHLEHSLWRRLPVGSDIPVLNPQGRLDYGRVLAAEKVVEQRRGDVLPELLLVDPHVLADVIHYPEVGLLERPQHHAPLLRAVAHEIERPHLEVRDVLGLQEYEVPYRSVHLGACLVVVPGADRQVGGRGVHELEQPGLPLRLAPVRRPPEDALNAPVGVVVQALVGDGVRREGYRVIVEDPVLDEPDPHADGLVQALRVKLAGGVPGVLGALRVCIEDHELERSERLQDEGLPGGVRADYNGGGQQAAVDGIALDGVARMVLDARRLQAECDAVAEWTEVLDGEIYQHHITLSMWRML